MKQNNEVEKAFKSVIQEDFPEIKRQIHTLNRPIVYMV